jgi:hypothetical protein
MSEENGVLGTLQEGHDVHLLVPARAEHLRAIRLVAADTAGRAGLDYEQTDDLRIAIDELCHCLMRVVEGPLSLTFAGANGVVTIEGSAPLRAGCTSILGPLSQAILQSVTEFFEIIETPPDVQFMLIVKEQP